MTQGMKIIITRNNKSNIHDIHRLPQHKFRGYDWGGSVRVLAEVPRFTVQVLRTCLKRPEKVMGGGFSLN